MSGVKKNKRKRVERIFLSSGVRYLFPILLLLPCLFPSSLLAQAPFDVSRVRRSVVRIVATRGNEDGTGSIIKVEGKTGYILTAYHVIREDAQMGVSHVEVELFGGDTVEARINRRLTDTTNDIALLEVRNLPSPPPLEIAWSSSSGLKDIQKVYAVGHPQAGAAWEVTQGTVSRLVKGKIYLSGVGMRPGNSGGPVLNEDGALVGMILYPGEALEGDVIRAIIRRWVKGLGKPVPFVAEEPIRLTPEPPKPKPKVPPEPPSETKDELIKELEDFFLRE